MDEGAHMPVIGLSSMKGGVGKTVAAVTLARLDALRGRRTLLVDLDPQGAAGWLLGFDGDGRTGAKRILKGKREARGAVRRTGCDGLDLLPAAFSFRRFDELLSDTKKPKKRLSAVLDPLRTRYDRIYLDCPPGVTLLSENVFRAADLVLVPLVPAPLSVRTFEELTAFFERTGIGTPIRPFLSMVDRRKKLHRTLAEELSDRLPGLLSASVPLRSEVERMGVRRPPLPRSALSPDVARAFERLLDEVDAIAGASAPAGP